VRQSLKDIARRTGLPVRRLRYVLYHGLVPTLPTHGSGRGFARRFDEEGARSIGIAAALLEAGLPRGEVTQCLRHIVTSHARATSARRASGHLRRLDVAERQYLRRVTRNGAGPWTAMRSAAGPPPHGYQPLFTVTLNLERLESLLGC